jgi:hypothetical protein
MEKSVQIDSTIDRSSCGEETNRLRLTDNEEEMEPEEKKDAYK